MLLHFLTGSFFPCKKISIYSASGCNVGFGTYLYFVERLPLQFHTLNLEYNGKHATDSTSYDQGQITNTNKRTTLK